MTHQAYEAQQPVVWDADYVVIGTGAGGAAAASQLARGGAKVVMVEAGPWRDPSDYPSSVYGSFRDLFDHWGTTVARPSHLADHPGSLRGRVDRDQLSDRGAHARRYFCAVGARARRRG